MKITDKNMISSISSPSALAERECPLSLTTKKTQPSSLKELLKSFLLVAINGSIAKTDKLNPLPQKLKKKSKKLSTLWLKIL
jgi:hypothetical protein